MVHRVSLSPRIDILYLFILFAMKVAQPGWNIVLTFHVTYEDADLRERKVWQASPPQVDGGSEIDQCFRNPSNPVHGD